MQLVRLAMDLFRDFFKALTGMILHVNKGYQIRLINFMDIIECLNVFEKAGMINKLRKRDKYY